MSELDAKDLQQAAEKLAGRDRVGIAAEGGATALAAAAGVAASGTLASALGVSTLFGSTTLASSILGTVFVTSTPIGWVIGSALAAGALGLGIAKACNSGGQNDYIRAKWTKVLEKKAMESRSSSQSMTGEGGLQSLLLVAVSEGRITPEKSRQISDLVTAGQMSVDTATRRLRDLKIASTRSHEVHDD